MIEFVWNVFVYTNAGWALALSFFIVTVGWIIAQRIGRYDLIDVVWPGIFASIALLTFALHPAAAILDKQRQDVGLTPRIAVTGLVCVWAVRLGVYLYKRWRRNDIEDYRYVELRKKWPRRQALHMYIKVFLLQGLLAWVIMFPVMLINFLDGRADVFLGIGIAVWCVGFFFQTVGDAQLAKFVQDSANKRKILATGLWQYTRHPNYFGEVVMWWGIFIVNINYYAESVPIFIMSLVGPLVITYLIMRVSGVPLAEKHLEGRREWQGYKRRTSVFLPLPPRR